MSKVLQKLDFKNFRIKDESVIGLDDKVKHSHDCQFFKGSETFTFVSSIRNPYSREVSNFRFNIDKSGNKKKFKEYLKESNEFQILKLNQCFNFNRRKPDFFVRLENLFEDYSNIPFVSDSKIYRNGYLKKLTETKINQNEDQVDWKLFYDDENSEIVYNAYAKHFEIFNYDKNSWKK